MTALTRRRLLQAGGLAAASLAVPTIPGALASTATTAVAIAGDPLGRGYWLLRSDGSVEPKGSARVAGALPGLGAPAALAALPRGGGFVVVGANGRVFGNGAATLTAAPATQRDSRVVAAATNARGDGVWRVTALGQILVAGQTKHLGAPRTQARVVGLAGHPEQAGYWVLDRDGKVHAFGAARVLGPAAGGPAADIAAHPGGDGYWVLRADGRVAAYGAAAHFGDAAAGSPAVGIAAAADGAGYWVARRDGSVARFGSARTGLAANGELDEPAVTTVGGIVVAQTIGRRLRGLLEHAKDDGFDLGGWGYRSYTRQIELREQNCGPRYYDVWVKSSSECSPMTARPGSSMHEQGLAIDFFRRRRDGGTADLAGTRAFRWMARNAKTYGLYNLPSEPWHWSTNGR